ncbi:MAG TPA: histidine kinase [Verrucomicrobiae bacterium]|nr:histidine kinase [Verrucomicrobiae bacterium]
MGNTCTKIRPWLLIGILFGLCSLLAGLSIIQGYVCDIGTEQQKLLGSMVRQELKGWYAIGLVSIAVIWFAARNPPRPGAIGRWLCLHLAMALVCSAGYSVLTSALVAGERSVMHPGEILTFSYLIGKYWPHYLICYLIVYWIVVVAQLGWHYYNRYREREVETAQLQRELVEARLEALRMQLNPHFLFNTLHAVSALIHENPNAADRVVARLSELLRLSLDQTKPQEVPLSEELAFLDRYLEIEQMRFAERLKVEKTISKDVQNALVPYLILQPIVENAIRHGIEPREDLGLLQISADHKDGRLFLRVRDNGYESTAKAAQAAPEGIGLSNTRSRLRHLYGDDFQFELAADNGCGLEARMEIPFHTRNGNGTATNG